MTKSPRLSLEARLKRERKRRNWTQEYVANQIGATVLSLNRWENGKATPHAQMLQALIDLFGRPVEAWGASRARIWTVPYLRNLYFTGRERILARLHAVLTEQNVIAISQARAISGLGGIGKTQTALEYAYRYADEYDLVLWVRADSRQALLAQFASLAALFGLPNHADADQSRLAQATKRHLETQDEEVWLLILDNVDDVALVQEFLPTRGNGAVLLTTRLHAVGKHLRKIELDTFSMEESRQFLLERVRASRPQALEDLSEDEEQAIEQLCTLLDGLPLALDQAAAYMEEHQTTVTDYVARYLQQRTALLRLQNSVDRHDYPDSVATTWLLSFQQVEQANPVAADLLYLLAFLHPDTIPEALLQEEAAELGPHLQTVAEHPARLQEALSLVQQYSLIRRNAESGTLSIHRLVQAVIQDGLEGAQARQWAERAVRLVNHAFPEGEFTDWDRCEQLLPHALVCAEHLRRWQVVSEEAGYLLHRAGEYLFWRARYAEALALTKQAAELRQQALGATHPDVAESLNNLGIMHSDQGHYAEALTLHQQALSVWEQALGPEDPSVALGLNNLADIYRLLGRYSEALPLYQRALALEERTHGPTHSQVANYLNNLALVYQAQGEYADARQCFERALSIWEQASQSNHPHLAICLNNLGGLYRVQGQYAEARQCFERALSIDEQLYRPDHPEVAQSLYNLANLFQSQGDYDQARALFERALTILEQGLGPTHPRVAARLNSLAQLHQAQGHDEEALPLYQRALAIQEQALGPTHPDLAETLHQLARLREAQGHLEEARNGYAQALAIREQALGAQHPHTRETRQRLIAVLQPLGQHEEAVRLEEAQAEQGTSKTAHVGLPAGEQPDSPQAGPEARQHASEHP